MRKCPVSQFPIGRPKHTQAPTVPRERTYPAERNLPHPGAQSVYLLREGSVALLRQQSGKEEQIATLGGGDMLGSLEGFSNFAPGVAARTLEPTTLHELSSSTYQRGIATLPRWFSGLMKIMFRRASNSKRRTPSNEEFALVELMRLLIGTNTKPRPAWIPYRTVVLEAYHLSGLGKARVDRILRHLQAKGILKVDMDQNGQQRLHVFDSLVLSLYAEFLKYQITKTEFVEHTLSEPAVTVFLKILEFIASDASTGDRIVFARRKLTEGSRGQDIDIIDRGLLELHKKNLVHLEYAENEATVCCSRTSVIRAKRILEWMPRFSRSDIDR